MTTAALMDSRVREITAAHTDPTHPALILHTDDEPVIGCVRCLDPARVAFLAGMLDRVRHSNWDTYRGGPDPAAGLLLAGLDLAAYEGLLRFRAAPSVAVADHAARRERIAAALLAGLIDPDAPNVLVEQAAYLAGLVDRALPLPEGPTA